MNKERLINANQPNLRPIKSTILTIAVLFFTLSSFSQGTKFEWAKGIGGTSYDIGYSITTDASGNIYTTGYFNGTVDFDPGGGTFNLTSVGGMDIFISKVNSSGDFLWAKGIGGTSDDYGKSITTDESGNVYTTGYFQGTADFDPGLGTFNLTSAGGEDIFISKLNSSGDFLWTKRLGGTSDDASSSITTDGSGNVYTTGSFYETVDFDPGSSTFNLTSAGYGDIFISKLNSSGNFLWAKSMGGTSTGIGNSIITDASGNVYTTGYFVGTGDFDPSSSTFNLTSAGNTDIFISKLNSSGDFLWAKGVGGNGSDYGRSITIDVSGNVYTTGSFAGTIDFDPGLGTFNLTSAGNNFLDPDIFISKLNSSGDFVWGKRIGGYYNDEGVSITTDVSGNIYTTGYFDRTVDFDPGVGTFNLTSASGGSGDVFISKLNSSGDFVWGKRIGGNSFDICNSITTDVSGNIYTTGYFNGTVDFDPGSSTFNLTSDNADIFISKIYNCDIQVSFLSSPLCSTTGEITLSATGGVGNYNYSFDNGLNFQTNPTFIYSNNGAYSVVVKDGVGCEVIHSFNLSMPSIGLSLNTNIQNTACGSNTGSLTAYASGGTSPYTYLWSDSATTSSIQNLAVGDYSLIVTDFNGCTISSSVSTISVADPNFGINFSASATTGTAQFLAGFTNLTENIGDYNFT